MNAHLNMKAFPNIRSKVSNICREFGLYSCGLNISPVEPSNLLWRHDADNAANKNLRHSDVRTELSLLSGGCTPSTDPVLPQKNWKRNTMIKTSDLFAFAASCLFVAALPGSMAKADIETGLAALDAGDVVTAAAEFQSSFEAGYGDGAFYLGRLFEFGLGADADLSRAASLYAAGAGIGSILAMNRLGMLYLEGTTLLRDYPEAARLFCASADAGDATGQLNCALMLRDGRGVDADPELAFAYLEQAAQQGDITARNLLGKMLATGDGVSADPERARALFLQTAQQGNAVGLFELAKSYVAEGDLVRAYIFANLAAVRQHQQARSLRDDLETQMTSEQINAGQEQAKVWTASRIAELAATQQEQSE